MDFLKTLMISSSGLKVQNGRMRIIAENIAGCIEILKDMKWDGVLSIECEAAPGNVEKSLEWPRKEIAR